MKKAGAVISLGIILVLPLLVYLVLRTGSHQLQVITHLGPKIANPDGSPDSVFHRVGPFAFTNQAGNTITSDSTEGKIMIAGLFFTSSPGISPKMARGMIKLQEEFAADPSVRLMLISVDPKRDSVPALVAFANKYEAIPGKWDLLTGEKAEIEAFARKELYLECYEGKGGEMGFHYATDLRVVDHEGELRGSWSYDGTIANDLDTLITHVRLLEIEHARKKR